MKSKSIVKFTGALLIGAVLMSFASTMLAVDEYKVIKVNGKILYKTNGKSMATGDVFKSNTTLDFKTTTSRAAVVSKEKGRFVLTPQVGKSKSNLVPAVNNMSSRSGAILNTLDLQNHFNGRYVVIGKAAIEVGEKAYPLNDEHFFYIQYNFKDEVIRKKLKSSNNAFSLSADEIFNIDGKAIKMFEAEMSLYYRDEADKKSIKISSFTPIFPDTEELKEEVKIIVDEYAGESNDKVVQEITAYVNEFYGKPNKENLNSWLKKNYDL